MNPISRMGKQDVMGRIGLSFSLMTVFCICMGFLESAVVIYLRKIYYPHGFAFPLAPMDSGLVLVEFLREISTVIMLLLISFFAGRNSMQRFGWFLFCFAVWDVFYYVFLWIFDGWPESFFTWDILFLIPIPWTGQVITPLMVAGGMLVFGISLVLFNRRSGKNLPSAFEWILLMAGALTVIVAWCWEYCRQALAHGSMADIWTLSGELKAFEGIESFIPQEFNWGLFLAGLGLCCLGFILYYRRMRCKKPQF